MMVGRVAGEARVRIFSGPSLVNIIRSIVFCSWSVYNNQNNRVFVVVVVVSRDLPARPPAGNIAKFFKNDESRRVSGYSLLKKKRVFHKYCVVVFRSNFCFFPLLFVIILYFRRV